VDLGGGLWHSPRIRYARRVSPVEIRILNQKQKRCWHESTVSYIHAKIHRYHHERMNIKRKQRVCSVLLNILHLFHITKSRYVFIHITLFLEDFYIVQSTIDNIV